MTLARCEAASRTYGHGGTATTALQPATCEVNEGARTAIVGPSGSGKTTLLHLLAGLDSPTTGRVSWPAIGGIEALRPGPVAVIFQGPSLLGALSVEENVALPALLAGASASEARAHAGELLDLLELRDLADKLPEEISGGQSQRVATARALAGSPRLILADEPTGQLDRASSRAVVDVLLEAAAHSEAALVISTHDPSVAERLHERWEIHGGRLRSEGPAWSR